MDISNTQMDTNKLEKIDNMYAKLTYFDQYGGSVLLFIVITLVVIVLMTYFHIMINVQPILNDWPNQRCKPHVLPIAGFITHPEGVSASEYTMQNFNYCTQNILSGVAGQSLYPITHVTNVLQSVAAGMQQQIQSIRIMFDKVRSSMQNVSQEIMGRLINVMVPLQQMIMGFRDLIAKIQGTMTAALFTLLGSYYTLKSLMGAIAQFMVSILIALSVMIAMMWAIPFTWGAAAANTAIYMAIAIPMAIVLTFMNKVLHINSTHKIPKVKCFDKNTFIEMNDGTFVAICNIQTGDILSNNNKVTAVIKVATAGSTMYRLNNVIVSNSHIVKDNNNEWISVETHCDARKIANYVEPYLYCLNTRSKTIPINGTVFTDWDEVIDAPLYNTIHPLYDAGFAKNTLVKLHDGGYSNISQIKVNDVLFNNNHVYGIVQIEGLDLAEQYTYTLGENNAHSFSTFAFIEGVSNDIPFTYKQPVFSKHPTLYHLLTEQNVFTLKCNTVIHDYNYAVDHFYLHRV